MEQEEMISIDDMIKFLHMEIDMEEANIDIVHDDIEQWKKMMYAIISTLRGIQDNLEAR